MTRKNVANVSATSAKSKSKACLSETAPRYLNVGHQEIKERQAYIMAKSSKSPKRTSTAPENSLRSNEERSRPASGGRTSVLIPSPPATERRSRIKKIPIARQSSVSPENVSSTNKQTPISRRSSVSPQNLSNCNEQRPNTTRFRSIQSRYSSGTLSRCSSPESSILNTRAKGKQMVASKYSLLNADEIIEAQRKIRTRFSPIRRKSLNRMVSFVEKKASVAILPSFTAELNLPFEAAVKSNKSNLNEQVENVGEVSEKSFETHTKSVIKSENLGNQFREESEQKCKEDFRKDCQGDEVVEVPLQRLNNESILIRKEKREEILKELFNRILETYSTKSFTIDKHFLQEIQMAFELLSLQIKERALTKWNFDGRVLKILLKILRNIPSEKINKPVIRAHPEITYIHLLKILEKLYIKLQTTKLHQRLKEINDVMELCFSEENIWANYLKVLDCPSEFVKNYHQMCKIYLEYLESLIKKRKLKRTSEIKSSIRFAQQKLKKLRSYTKGSSRMLI